MLKSIFHFVCFVCHLEMLIKFAPRLYCIIILSESVTYSFKVL